MSSDYTLILNYLTVLKLLVIVFTPDIVGCLHS